MLHRYQNTQRRMSAVLTDVTQDWWTAFANRPAQQHTGEQNRQVALHFQPFLAEHAPRAFKKTLFERITRQYQYRPQDEPMTSFPGPRLPEQVLQTGVLAHPERPHPEETSDQRHQMSGLRYIYRPFVYTIDLHPRDFSSRADKANIGYEHAIPWRDACAKKRGADIDFRHRHCARIRQCFGVTSFLERSRSDKAPMDTACVRASPRCSAKTAFLHPKMTAWVTMISGRYRICGDDGPVRAFPLPSEHSFLRFRLSKR